MFDLKGKTAIITGGAGTLGSAMAQGLAEAGVKVGILSRTEEKVEQTVAEIEKLGGEALALAADVLDTSQLIAVREKAMHAWGKIDILINCAGGNKRGATIQPNQSFFDLSIEDFDSITALNLKGTVLPTLVFGEQMCQQESACVINISSMAADRALTRVFGYGASKAAIDNVTKWLAVEMAQKYGGKVRVNAIAPGFFVGEQNRRLLTKEDGTYTERAQTIINQTPMGRFGDPRDLCGAVNWLCSDAASFVTGIVLPIDGGFSAFSGV